MFTQIGLVICDVLTIAGMAAIGAVVLGYGRWWA